MIRVNNLYSPIRCYLCKDSAKSVLYSRVSIRVTWQNLHAIKYTQAFYTFRNRNSKGFSNGLFWPLLPKFLNT